MKNLFSLIMLVALIAAFATIAAPVKARAGDLSYSTLVPQTGDSDLIIKNKGSLVVAPKLYSNITATGTTSVTAVVLDRVVINSAGSADSKVVLTDGTAALASVTTATQGSLAFGAGLASGTLKAITTGTTSPNVLLIYR